MAEAVPATSPLSQVDSKFAARIVEGREVDAAILGSKLRTPALP